MSEHRRHPHPDVGLLTRATPNFTYGRTSPGRKVHTYEAVLIWWEQHPFPKVKFITKCGGRQFSHVYPECRETFTQDEVCQRCFPNVAPSTLMIRSMERRESIVEAVESQPGVWTYRDIWHRCSGSFSLTHTVVREMVQHHLVRVVSPEGQLPVKMVTNWT